MNSSAPHIGLTSTAATQLISELKVELAAQTALAKESEELRKQLEASEVKAENLEGNIETLNSSLSEAEAEIKTLSNKLAAVRSGNANPRVPGSAIKASGPANRTAQAEAAHAAQAIAQAKENLYADMTGLIMRGVKQEEIGDTFDCIQTGRNGSKFNGRWSRSICILTVASPSFQTHSRQRRYFRQHRGCAIHISTTARRWT